MILLFLSLLLKLHPKIPPALAVGSVSKRFWISPASLPINFIFNNNYRIADAGKSTAYFLKPIYDFLWVIVIS